MNRHTILVFDPERDMADLLIRAIESHLSSKCYLAVSEEHCLALLKEIPFDLALLDYDAISANGFKLLQKIRREFAQVVVVVQSYLHQQDQAQAAKVHGADALLIKPIPIKSFREKLNAILAQSRSACHQSGDKTVS
jgi:DNA-binding response OmpR family regulator